jgi:hypothetical protein
MFASPRGRLTKLSLAVSAVLVAAAISGSTGAQAAKSHPFLNSFTGAEAPLGEFEQLTGIAVAPNGYVYITSLENSAIFVYDASHHYVTTISESEPSISPAVDSEGNIYVVDPFANNGAKVVVFEPSQRPPTSATTYTESTVMETFLNSGSETVEPKAVAVNPTNDHADVATQKSVTEFESVAAGSGLVTETRCTLNFGLAGKNYLGIQIGATGKIYLANEITGASVIGIASPDGTTELHKIENTSRPFENLGENSIAVDRTTGNVFVGQTNSVSGAAVVEEFAEDGTLVSEIGPTFDGSKTFEGVFPLPGLAVDNSTGGSSGNVYVGSGFVNSELLEFGPLSELFNLTVTKAGAGAGTVSGGSAADPAGIACGSVCTHEFASGASVTLTATPAAGSEFTGWTGACSGASSCVVSMSEAKAVSATFGIATVKPVLAVTKSGTGVGTVVSVTPSGIDCGVTCTAAFSAGTAVTLTATAASGSEFKGWTGACSGTGSCTVTMSTAQSVGAQFDVAAGGGGGGGGNGGGGATQTCPTTASLCPPAVAQLAKSAPVAGGKAEIKMSCPGPGACSGTLKVSAKLKVGKSKKPKTVKIKLSSAANKALKGGKSLTATVSGSGIAPGTVRLRLSGSK